MDSEKVSKYTFFLLMIAIFYVVFLIIRPYFTYVILAMIFGFLFYPVYKWLYSWTKRPNFSAAIMTLFIILLLVIPALFTLFTLIDRTKAVVENVNAGSDLYEEFGVNDISAKLSEKLGKEIDISGTISSGVNKIGESIIHEKALGLVDSIADILMGIFMMFFIIFYIFRGGKQLYSEIKSLVPLKTHYKIRLFSEMESMMHAIIYGQIITSIVQGVLCGIGLYVAQVPNALFWTFITILIGFIPFIGTPIVFVPASAYLILNDQIGAAIGLLVYGFVIVMNIDNVLKPRIIGNRARVHPVLVLLGVIGGLKLFGFIGLIIGPIIMALFIIFLRLYSSDFEGGSHNA